MFLVDEKDMSDRATAWNENFFVLYLSGNERLLKQKGPFNYSNNTEKRNVVMIPWHAPLELSMDLIKPDAMDLLGMDVVNEDRVSSRYQQQYFDGVADKVEDHIIFR